MRIGVFGGTFDPIHLAHLRVAEEVREALDLGRVLFIPAGVPPHRPRPVASPAQRLAMVRLAVAGHPAFAVWPGEIRRAGASYTVDTLAQLTRLHPRDQFFLILGMDQVRELPRWHQPTRLLALCHIAALSRPGEPARPARLRLPRSAYTTIDVSALDISATDIRRRIHAGRSVCYLVPDAVIRYLKHHSLYLPTGPKAKKTKENLQIRRK